MFDRVQTFRVACEGFETWVRAEGSQHAREMGRRELADKVGQEAARRTKLQVKLELR